MNTPSTFFYTPDIDNSLFYTLGIDESHHAVKVLRHRRGDPVKLVDGKGNLFISEIIEAHPKRCAVAVKEIRSHVEKKTHYLHIAIAPPKNPSRFEFFLEKSTEIGIDEITPLVCERSERKQFNHDRLEKIIISAMKQSERAWKPHLNKFTPFESLLSKLSTSAESKFIAHLSPDYKESLNQWYKKGSKSVVLIGPEGDFTSTEILYAMKAGFKPVRLGNHRLRTETAGIAVCTIINFANL